tara:strand:- start:54 stop:503 length:450 start_codon:yes stop_codon:yes gene_type:complete
MSELPFPLAKDHKSKMRCKWKKRGMIFRDDGHFEFVYYEYIRATKCELCNKLFPNSINRQLDHDHNTGDPRNIVCCKCNLRKKDNKKIPTNTGYDYIHKRKDKNYKTGYCFRIKIVRDEQNIINTTRKSLEEAIIVRDEFLAAHPEIYT